MLRGARARFAEALFAARLCGGGLLVAALLAGCYESHGPASGGLDGGGAPGLEDGGGVRRSVDAGSVDAPDGAARGARRAVDLLFVVDNSISMEEEQATLAAEVPRLVSILTTGDFDMDGDDASDGESDDADFEPVSELSVAVVTTDMGSGGFSLPGCPLRSFGDDGLFRTRGADRPGCVTAYPGFLTFRPGGDPAAFAGDIACVATVGNAGCGLEQPLEAALKALSPAAPTPWTAPGYVPPVFFEDTPGHGDGANAGFVDDGALLALVVFTDDDDCSAADPSIFDVRDERWGRQINLRCTLHATELLHPVSRYVEGLLQLRRDPRRLVFAPVVGVPLDLVPGVGAPIDWPRIQGDPRLEPVVDPRVGSEVVPSCEEPGSGLAYPPGRILELARQLETRGAGVALQSICNDDAGALLEAVLERL